MNTKEMKKLLFELSLSDTDYYDTLEEIREAITPFLYNWHELFYMPNDDYTIQEVLDESGCSYCEMLCWAAKDNYNIDDDYIKYSSFKTISAEQLRDLYINNTIAILAINDIIESSDKEDLESIMETIDDTVEIIQM